MVTKVQTKRYPVEVLQDRRLKLTAMEKGLLRWSLDERGDKVLDTQVGTGLMLEYLHRNMECEICGISDDMQCVRDARTRLRSADIVYAMHGDFPWKADTFDSVYIKMTDGPVTERTLAEAMRVLKPGGQVLVGLKIVPWPLRQLVRWLRGDMDEDVLEPKARDRMLATLETMGWKQITWQPTDPLHSVCVAWKPVDVEQEDRIA